MLRRPRKSSLRARSLSDMLNVLLNAAIVSIGGRPSRSQIYFRCLFTSLPPRSSYRSFRRRTRARATLVPNEIYERAIPPAPLCSSGGSPVIGIRVFKSLFYQKGGQKKKSYISSDGGGIHMLRRLPEDPFGRFLRSQLFGMGFAQFPSFLD